MLNEGEAMGTPPSPDTAHSRRSRTRAAVARSALAVVLAQTVYVGFWAAAAPGSFARSFPGWGLSWIAPSEPVDPHFVTDVGLLHLALLVMAVEAWRRRVPLQALGLAWSVYAVPHLAYHVAHTTGLSRADMTTSLSALAISAAAGLVLVVAGSGQATARP
jgi:hypothetical protein